MRRVAVLLVIFLLLGACSVDEAEPVPETTEAETQELDSYEETEAPRPFSESDVWSIAPYWDGNSELGSNKTVGNYAKIAPAQSYKIEYTPDMMDGVRISFYDCEPEDTDGDGYVGKNETCPFLEIRTLADIPGYSEPPFVVTDTLPEASLSEAAEVLYVDFGKAEAIEPPRNITIGQSAQWIFDSFYGGREGYEHTDFFSPLYGTGKIIEQDIGYEVEYYLTYPDHDPAWTLSYYVDDYHIITGITYSCYLNLT